MERHSLLFHICTVGQQKLQRQIFKVPSLQRDSSLVCNKYLWHILDLYLYKYRLNVTPCKHSASAVSGFRWEASADGCEGHLTWEGILGFKESTKTSFHIRQAAFTFLVSLSLQVGNCHFELFKTEMKLRNQKFETPKKQERIKIMH